MLPDEPVTRALARAELNRLWLANITERFN
jgi:hypothetical protein